MEADKASGMLRLCAMEWQALGLTQQQTEWSIAQASALYEIAERQLAGARGGASPDNPYTDRENVSRCQRGAVGPMIQAAICKQLLDALAPYVSPAQQAETYLQARGGENDAP